MFLELSFNSQADSKKMSGSRAASSWRYDHNDNQEMSLDELISDFQQCARLSKLKGSVSGSDVSLLRVASPLNRSKMKGSNKKSGSFTERVRAVKQESVRKNPVKHVQHDDSSDDEGAVSPMPRIEHVLKNKPSLIPKRRSTPDRRRHAPIQRRKPDSRSPVLSSSSLSLSPLPSSSATSSPPSEDTYTSATPEEDSIDALIGKDIRDLNKLILTSSRGRQPGQKPISAARSPTTDEMSNVIRQSTRFHREESKRLRSPLRLHTPKRKFRSESPPPPPPDDEEDEDLFAEEILELRESRRRISMPAKTSEEESPKEEVRLENSDMCTTTALTIRNASHAISDLLIEALKPFENRHQEEDNTNTTEKEGIEGDTVIRNAMNAELQSATQTIVSELDLTFADMTERRKADLKAEAEAAAAVQEEEKKDKEAANEKKRIEEKESKEREMEILRLIPMQGKLLNCSADIETMLTQLEKTDTAMQDRLVGNTSVIDEEVKALRNHTQRRMQEIESQMSAAPPRENLSDPSDGVSWRAVDWVQDNYVINYHSPAEQSGSQRPEVIADVDTEAVPIENEGPFEEVLQRQVLEKLDLTILKLKHVLAIDTKEAVEAMEKQRQEKDEQARKQQQQQLEEEQTQQELEDAVNARRRVMGFTSIEEVEGWVEEGQQLRDVLEHDRSLNRWIASLENRMRLETASKPTDLPPNQEEAVLQWQLTNQLKIQTRKCDSSVVPSVKMLGMRTDLYAVRGT
ncbi:Hypothetical protein PHPALM_36928 [Phytophthora palmivora]|uniref:Uncharacterized protein n=1 Tax=Phytophthora palmivora TaxID=4796 RepID=A0A2P4WYQ1_9STRA|nr:Hypothetical protein PHPALM_36928 [Phytophthora palmivora]